MAKKKTVVCVDDDPQIIDSYREIFEGLGYDVKTGQNGFDLGCILNEETPNAMIVDLSMPGLNGLVAVKRMAIAHKKLLERTIVVSGIVDPEIKKELKRLNVRFLEKPVDFRELVSSVQILMGDLSTAQP
jgi:two-component system phosphoglycerate transport system response regulator PgtA